MHTVTTDSVFGMHGTGQQPQHAAHKAQTDAIVQLLLQTPATGLYTQLTDPSHPPCIGCCCVVAVRRHLIQSLALARVRADKQTRNAAAACPVTAAEKCECMPFIVRVVLQCILP
jgi:hypothetical protein